MSPIRFKESNASIKPPDYLTEDQCETVYAHCGQIDGGNMDGSATYTVAWLPGDAERERIASGECIYLTCLGGLPPHFLTVGFPCGVKERFVS